MSRIYNNITELVGGTPLVRLSRFAQVNGLPATLLAKLERQNPAGSAKDRIALNMLRAAQRDGRLAPGGTVVEPTSGNTGIGLCAMAAALGYRVIITMPDTMSVERRLMMMAYGAQLVLTDGAKGMKGAIEKAEEIARDTGGIVAGQFENPANPEAHYATTGPEIWEDTDGKVDLFVAGVGTGGTITGVGRYLREKKPDVQIVAVEPDTSSVLSGGKAGPHKLQGIGAGFVPETLDTSVYDAVLTATPEEAYAAARALARTEGILVGISSGAALAVAARLAAQPANEGKNIVVLLPDTGERYLSTELFSAE